MVSLSRRQLGFGAAGIAFAAGAGIALAFRSSPQPEPEKPAEILIGLVTGKSRAGPGEAIDPGGLPQETIRGQQSKIGFSLRGGVEAGIAELNAAGGVLGQKLKLVVEELDPALGSIRRQSIDAARRLVMLPGMVAVIGHVTPEDALPASITYYENDILFLSPTITLAELNGHGLANVFATVPDNKAISKQTATFAYGQGLRRVAVLRTRTNDAEEQTLGFLDQVGVLGMTETTRLSYNIGRKDFRDLLADLRAKPSDILFLATPAEDAVTIIRQSHELQIPVTYVIGGLRDTTVLVAGTKALPVNVIMPVLADPSIATPRQLAFDDSYRKLGRHPDNWVWQGYDTIGLLAAAINQSRSLEPEALMATLRYASAWTGLMGRYSFERNGRVYTRHLAFAQLQNGELSYYSTSVNLAG